MSRLAALLCLVLVAGCGPVDIVVANVPAEPDGGRPPPRKPCASNGDCPPDAFCEKPDCDALVGQCRPRPVFCDAQPAAVCGCNGVNYWNDCLRRDKGVSASVSGECAGAATCSTGADCPGTDASCARLLPSAAACATAPQGACWVLPPSCPSGTGGAWSPCAAGACVDTCAAIRSEAAHSRLSVCP